jgi:DNA-binding PadR family transcriptional regulator
MSPVFRHGRLRLYLLKLLDESPRHGYEVIRLLQDRFMGVYAPSPGTIYPRLARLEEEGLVTHDEADGRKVYRITDKGREELHARFDDLAELEEEITASVRDIAREVTEDVRETVRTLREELTWAAREFHTRAGQQAGGAGQGPVDGPRQAHERTYGEQAHRERDRTQDEPHQQRDQAKRERDRVRDEAHRQRDEAHRARDEAQHQQDEAHGERDRLRDEARRQRDEARRMRYASARDREDTDRRDTDRERQHEQEGADRDRQHEQEGPERDRWHEHAGRHWGQREWGDWAGWSGWGGWPGAAGPHGCQDPGTYRDPERLARQFSRELRYAAWQAQAISEDAVHDLRGILEDTIGRIRAEVFTAQAGPQPPGESSEDPGTPPTDAPAE